MTAFLEVRNVYKSYGSRAAVVGASLEIPRGICYGLLGPNGAGKSSLISIIAGTMAADSGEVRLDGQAVGLREMAPKRRVGYVPQELALYDDLTVRDNLRFVGSFYDLPTGLLKERIDFALTTAGLESRIDERVRTFSGGMKRRLNVVAALLHDPDFLILDEPTVGVDPQSRNLIFETIEALILEGKTILYTTHYMEEVERLCRRVAIMDAGRVVAEGGVNELHRLIPGQEVVHVQMSDRFDGSVASISGVRSANYRHPVLTLQLDNLSQDLPRVLEVIVHQGGVIESVRSERPSLEEVFLHLTGRTLRD